MLLKPKKPLANSLLSSTNTSAVKPGPFAVKRRFLNTTNSEGCTLHNGTFEDLYRASTMIASRANELSGAT
jgi:hypothetical protein